MINVLFVSFESLPFVKTGGLADVVAALPKAIDKDKYQVKTVLPLHKRIKERYYNELQYVDHIYINSGVIHEEANIYRYTYNDLEYLFIENDTYFYRESIYGYDDDVRRFTVFNVAVLEMMIKMNYYPDICHEHDYHTAILPALCKIRFNAIESIRRIKHIFTIHNLAYQGLYNKNVLFDLLGFDYRYYEDGSLRWNDDANFMKIGIVFADIVTTVSRTYAQEIQTPQFGENLDAVLKYRANDLYGIVNGIDVDIFNPKTDNIYQNYSAKAYKRGKLADKRSLQYELGLEDKPNTLLIGMVSRLTWQKGIDLIVNSLERILKMDVQVAILGSGESKYEYQLRSFEDRYKGKVVYYCGYNEGLAHRMYAGLDMLLMPSLFEPCGISQLIAMRYGTLPLVRETGGLKDTVEPLNEYEGTGRGFSFGPFDHYAFNHVFDYAYDQYYNHKDNWNKLIKNAMNYDVSFANSAREYEKIYDKVLGLN